MLSQKPKPDYLIRTRRPISTPPCISCLLDTENYAGTNPNGISRGDKLWYGTFGAERNIAQKVLAEKRPKSVADLGAGMGRVVQIVLNTLPDSRITAVESDRKILSHLENRFKNQRRVTVVGAEASEFLRGNVRFDLAVCLMATLGNINNPDFFRQIIEHSNTLVFSLYNHEFDEKRAEMYRARGHVNFHFDGKQYVFNDWAPGVSRAYGRDEIARMVADAGARLVEIKRAGALFVVTCDSHR